MKKHRIRITAVILSILIILFLSSNSDFFILSCCSECRGMFTDIHHSQKKKKKSISTSNDHRVWTKSPGGTLLHDKSEWPFPRRSVSCHL